MTRIALNTPSASRRLALRRWLEARGHEIRALDDPRVDLVLGDQPTGEAERFRRIPILDGSNPRIDFDALDRLLCEVTEEPAQMLDLSTPPPSEGLIARSPAMRELADRVQKLSGVELPVLITGESGSGKEVVARALHELGPRRDERFIAVNCAAIPESLFESELFGHERGSFTDASSRRHGYFERAGAGTLFLDEIAEIPTAIQAKLLRALQDRRFFRIGGEDPISFEARVLSASALDVEQDPNFRTDLYHRIAGARLRVPPLRERRQDLPDLCRTILARVEGHRVRGLEAPALDQLARFDWPGNVRQLENVLRQAAILATTDVLDLDTVKPLLGESGRAESESLDVAIRAWARRLRRTGVSPAELREELMERLRQAEDDLDQGADPSSQANDRAS
jgi:DNA-binding NtrC family response regulator